MTSLQSIIERTATKQMQFHAFAKEWRSAISAVWLLKFFTAIISIYAGIGYLANIADGAVGNVYAGWVVAIVMLFLLESLNATALFKGFKFLLRGRRIISGIALIVALFSFSASFTVSVNGIMDMQTAKADNSTEIAAKSDSAVINIKQTYKDLILEKKADIARIQANPQGWHEGKRTTLTNRQLNSISVLSTDIDDLRARERKDTDLLAEKLNAAVAAEKQAATGTGEQYYKLVSIIMLVQLFANFALTFFYAKIYAETEATKANTEDLEIFAKGLFSSMYEDVKYRYASLQSSFSRKASELFTDIAEQPILAPVSAQTDLSSETVLKAQNTPVNAPLTPPKQGNSIGFKTTAQQSVPQPVAHDETANYYYTHRPELCEAIRQQLDGHIYTTNRKLATAHACSEATVRNCRRAIVN